MINGTRGVGVRTTLIGPDEATTLIGPDRRLGRTDNVLITFSLFLCGNCSSGSVDPVNPQPPTPSLRFRSNFRFIDFCIIQHQKPNSMAVHIQTSNWAPGRRPQENALLLRIIHSPLLKESQNWKHTFLYII